MSEDNKRDCYEILDINKDASDQDIKAAFRKLAKKYHPDVSKEPNSIEKFKEINEAYSILSDKEKREQYDRFGYDAFNGQPPSNFNPGDLNDILGGLFGGLFKGGNMFGGGNGNHKFPKKGKDVIQKVELTFNESVYGCNKTINYSITKKCIICNGVGGVNEAKCEQCNGQGHTIRRFRTNMGEQIIQSNCENCYGYGKIYKNKCKNCDKGKVKSQISKDFKFPAGVNSGNIISLQNEGNYGENDGERGDLHFQVIVKEHPIFKRNNFDINLIVPITFVEAIIGCDKIIPTIYGNYKIEISPYTQNKDTQIIKEKGIVKIGTDNKEKGDLIIEFKVITPKTLTKEQSDLIEELNKTHFDNEDYDKLKNYLK
jgi:molecular chaperone DnaJ